MFTTKLTSLEVPSTRTESPCLRMQMDVYIRKSKLSMAIRQLLGISPPNESTSEKLFELLDSISLRHETLVRDSLESGTLRRRAITSYPSLPKQTVKWDTLDSNDIISWMRTWHEELRHDQQEFLELYMQEFGCTRNEAKARTFGVRYGTPPSLHDFRKGLHHNAVRMLPDYDFSSLEHRICGNKATSFILDDIFGSKEL